LVQLAAPTVALVPLLDTGPRSEEKKCERACATRGGDEATSVHAPHRHQDRQLVLS